MAAANKTKRIAYRNPIYVVYILFGTALFSLGALYANEGSGPLETALFNALNHLPDFFIWYDWFCYFAYNLWTV